MPARERNMTTSPRSARFTLKESKLLRVETRQQIEPARLQLRQEFLREVDLDLRLARLVGFAEHLEQFSKRKCRLVPDHHGAGRAAELAGLVEGILDLAEL